MAVTPDAPQKITHIKAVGKNAGLPKILGWNVSAILHSAKGKCALLPAGWLLTDEGKRQVKILLSSLSGGPSPVLVSKLKVAVAGIKNGQSRLFVEEAIDAFEHGLLRSAVVLSWVGAVSVLYDHVIAHHLSAFNAEAHRRDGSWRAARNSDDLSLMKESTFLENLAAIGVLSKNVKEFLKNNCLALRNAAGHPNSFTFGPVQVEAHIEHLVLNVFQRF